MLMKKLNYIILISPFKREKLGARFIIYVCFFRIPRQFHIVRYKHAHPAFSVLNLWLLQWFGINLCDQFILLVLFVSYVQCIVSIILAAELQLSGKFFVDRPESYSVTHFFRRAIDLQLELPLQRDLKTHGVHIRRISTTEWKLD